MKNILDKAVRYVMITVIVIMSAITGQVKAQQPEVVGESNGFYLMKNFTFMQSGLLGGNAITGNAIVDPYRYRLVDEPYFYPHENGVLEIPDNLTIEGVEYKVEIVDVISNQPQLTEIIYPSDYIGAHAILNCENLRRIDFGNGQNAWGPIGDMPALEEMSMARWSGNFTVIDGFNELGLKQWAPDCKMVLERMALNNWSELETLDLQNAQMVCDRSVCRHPKLQTLILPFDMHGVTNDAGGVESSECFNGLTSLESVRMPGQVSGIFFNCFTGCNPKHIYCPSAIPATLMDGMYYGDDTNAPSYIGKGTIDLDRCIVHVPEGAAEIYKAHTSWLMFKNFVEDMAEGAAVKSVMTDNDGKRSLDAVVYGGRIIVGGRSTGFDLYDISGKGVENEGLCPGIYLVHASDGRTAKVQVK